ncbi:hypothetical protein ACRAWF_27515 [Streptomyces sp. L7]
MSVTVIPVHHPGRGRLRPRQVRRHPLRRLALPLRPRGDRGRQVPAGRHPGRRGAAARPRHVAGVRASCGRVATTRSPPA